MIVWDIRLDRRAHPRDVVASSLVELAQGVEGMTLELVPDDDFEDAPDAGKFRDFIALGRLSHTNLQALEYVAEELLHQFGWGVDFKPATD